MTSAQEYLAARAAAIDAGAGAGELPGRGLPWLQAQRRAALARFESVGFPSRRDEDWRYTNIAPLAKQLAARRFQPAARVATVDKPLDVAPVMSAKAARLMVFYDGLFCASHSTAGDDGDGVTVASLARVLNEHPERIADIYGDIAPTDAHGFTALNAAHSRDGVAVIIDADARPTPVELLFISSGAFESTPRNIIIVGSGGAATVVERHVSLDGDGDGDAAFTNSVTEIALADDAQLDYHLIQAQSSAAHHVCGVWARQSRASRLNCTTVTLGGDLVRNDLSVELAGEDAHCEMRGLYAATGRQHVDNHTTIVHSAAHCTSREIYKGVLDMRARAVFHGRVTVAKGAQKTDATQANNNLLLSRGAEIDTKPQLEIYADDVKCAHGATVGQLDADALFYLRARGIDAAAARRMLTFAFANDILATIAHDELQSALVELLHRRLGDGGGDANARASMHGTPS